MKETLRERRLKPLLYNIGQVIGTKYQEFVEANAYLGKIFIIGADAHSGHDVPCNYIVEYVPDGKKGKTKAVVKFQLEYTDLINVPKFETKLQNCFEELKKKVVEYEHNIAIQKGALILEQPSVIPFNQVVPE